jgi:predicted transcriptional regulator YdeE
MLQHDVEIVTRKQMNLVGFSVEASLNDDVLGAIVVGLREKLASQVAEIPHSVDRSMMLVQVYPDCDWTPDVVYTHIVAIEVDNLSAVPEEMVVHVVPEGRFLRFMHQGDESSIDATHVAINEWLDLHGYTDAREFDIEHWGALETLQNADNFIEIYVPIV